MSRLDLTFGDVYNQVSSFLGTGSTPTGTDLTRAQNIVYRAYRQFIYPTYGTDSGRRVRHLWSWLKKRYTLNTVADQTRYQLPVDFSKMIVRPTFSAASGYAALTKVSCEHIDNLQSMGSVSAFPSYYAINPLRGGVDQEQLWEIWLWPVPSGVYTIKFVYLISPEKPTASTDYFLGGPEGGEVILEMALGIAEQQEDDLNTKHHTETGYKLLSDMIIADDIDTPETVGKVSFGPDNVFNRRYTKTEDGNIYWSDRT